MTDRYAAAGVDVQAADSGIARMVPHLRRTWRRVRLEVGYFANVVAIGGVMGVASTIDGVGSKTEVARELGKWDTVGVDCVAANANDLICVGARPVSLVDYVGTDLVDADVLEGIARGLATGGDLAELSVVGGEISQLPGMIRGADLVGAAVGVVRLDRVIDGGAVRPGDVVIGLASSGIHCNGLTLARRVLPVSTTRIDELGRTVGEELLEPTRVYVREVLDEIMEGEVHAAVNVTGDGLLNLNRVAADGILFELDGLPEPPPIFGVIRDFGRLDAAAMFGTFNMGVGFCLVVAPGTADAALRRARRRGPARIIGRVTVAGRGRSVLLPSQGLIGRGKGFAPWP